MGVTLANKVGIQLPSNCGEIVLNLGYGCNNRCIFCLNGDRREQQPAVSEKEIKKTLDGLKHTAPTVIFTGGEPSIKDNFFKILEYANERFDNISIWSNLRAFSDMTFAKKVMDIKPDIRYEVSLHSIIPAQHDSFVRVKGAWKQTIGGIKNLVNLGGNNICVVFGIFKQNYTNLPAAVEFLSKLNIREIDFVLVRKEGYATEAYPTLLPKIERVSTHLFDAFEKAGNYGIKTRIMGIPFCCLKKYESHAFELGLANSLTNGHDLTYVSQEGTSQESDRVKRRVKLVGCKKCKYFLVCEGILAGYIEVYGLNEFIPVKGKKIETAFELATLTQKPDGAAQNSNQYQVRTKNTLRREVSLT